jgi:peptidoglycan/xylan/chitin deacetylase (PgdA/CDA1 family)
MTLTARAKKPLTAVYCGATFPLRWLRNARLIAAGQAPVLVLFYHRVADHVAVPWSHTNAEFERQMRWLKQRFEMISLEEAQKRIRSGHNDRLSACVTFDDGYAENCDHAIPLLIEEQIPCTYFVSTHFVLEQEPFPHDLLRGFRSSPNTIEQIRMMSDSGIEVAAHTRTHPNMAAVHDPKRIHEEFVIAGQELEDMTGRRVRYFAFPYGMPCNMTPLVFHLAREQGYEGVCSAYGDYNFPGDDAFHIRRVHPDDMVRLRNWGTIDPRKQWWRPRYDYLKAVIDPAEMEAVLL